jgi:hypothetical protein
MKMGIFFHTFDTADAYTVITSENVIMVSHPNTSDQLVP